MEGKNTDTVHLPLESMIDVCKTIAKKSIGVIIEDDRRVTCECPFGGFYTRNIVKSDCQDLKQTIKSLSTTDYPEMITFEGDCDEKTEEELGKLGLIRAFCQIGMVFDLSSEFEYVSEPKIVLLKPEDHVDLANAVQTGFVTRPREEGALKTLLNCDNVHCYGYIENDLIVGTGILTINGNLSGIHEVCTIPEARGKGIATSIVKRMLEDARSSGAEYVSLQASKMGCPVYEKIGFETVSMIHTWKRQTN